MGKFPNEFLEPLLKESLAEGFSLEITVAKNLKEITELPKNHMALLFAFRVNTALVYRTDLLCIGCIKAL